jgi:hypothetical protein
MAFWQRRSGKVRVLYWDSDSKKQRVLSRNQTEHLDDKSDQDVSRWVVEWSRQNERPSHRVPVVETNARDVQTLVDTFTAYLARHENLHILTIDEHRRNLFNYALPYFTREKGLTAVQDFPKHSLALVDWLSRRGASPKKVKSVNQTLNKFWRWLSEEGEVSERLILRRLPLPSDQTPLRYTLTPGQVLAWNPDRDDIRLLGLIAYFFSLRPQEAVALSRADFAAGDVASRFESSLVMAKCGLFDRLVVRVERQVSKKVKGTLPPKVCSKGVVTCFSREAALEIVERLNRAPLDGRLFPYIIDTYQHQWSKRGVPETTLKDMRRASLYWLGHYTDISLPALKNHARHHSIETTALYTRRPVEDFAGSAGPISL